jgi:predicted  nucleic acid-binding Zn-ribbon protein
VSSLRDKLKALEELQQVDLELHDVRTRLAGLPARRSEAEAAIAEARRAYDEERARMDANERERRQLESLLGMERDKVKKWEGRLGEIKTPREYAALSREIDIAKKTNDTQSEQIRELGLQGVEIHRALEAKEEALADREEAAQADLAGIEKERAECEERARGLEARRADAAKRVEPALLSRYENIKRRRAGVAIAQVSGMTCQGCHRNIPPQLAIILQRANSIENCPSCHRIIYSVEALNPTAPPPTT